MSSRRGAVQRTRPQKHQNRTVFKNDLHDNSDRIKKLNAMSINEICEHCRDVIQWKIKYRKYKALSQPKSCNRCNQKTVKKAYHVLCKECALVTKQCAKCLKTEEQLKAEGREIIPPEPTEQERIKIDVEMRHLVKSLSERKRRTFLRYMNGKKEKRKNKDLDEDDLEVDAKPKKMPTREELLDKLEQLKVSDKDEDFYADIMSSDDESYDAEEWESDIE